MRALFAPAEAVMRRLSYGKKFMVTGLLSLLAVLVLIVNLYTNLSQVLVESEHELAGLAQIERVITGTQLLQRHRGIAAAALGGVIGFADKLEVSRRQVDGALADLEQVLPVDSIASRRFAEIKADWAALQPPSSRDLLENYRLHTVLVEKLLDLQQVIGDETLLFTDSSLDSYHLIMLVTDKMPLALEAIGQLRAYGVGILAERRISEQQKLDLLVLKAQIVHATKSIAEITEHASRYDPALQPILFSTRENIVTASQLITDFVIPDIVQENFSVKPEYFFSTVTVALDTAYAHTHETFLPTIEQLLKARIARAEHVLRLSIGIPCALFGLIIYFAIGAHLSVSRGLADLAGSARAFAGGDLSRRISLVAADEIGQVANSFNEMADGFAGLLAERQRDEVRLRNIVNTALDAVVQMDALGAVRGWNRQAEQIFGWTESEALGQALHDLVIPERYRDLHRQGLQHFLETGEGPVLNQRIEITALHRDGREFPIELAITPNQWADTTEFSAFIRDISEQKKALQTLQTSEHRYRALFQSSRDALMTLSPSRGFLSGNSAAIQLFGCRDEAEFLAQTPASLSPEYQADGRQSAESALEKIELALAEGAAAFEWLHQRLNGETFIVEVQLSRVDIDGDVVLQASVRDISERKKARAALMTSEARTRAVLRTMSDAVVLIDTRGNMLLVNDAIGDLFGYEEDELLGQNVKMLMPEPHRSEHDGYLARHLDTKDRVIIGRRTEVEGKHKDGRLIPIELSVNELMDDFGSTYIGVMRDISQRKAIEQAREAARLEAEHLAHTKSEFLANMSHEIRTPLNAIIGLAKINLRNNPSSNWLENSQRIYDAGMHLLNVVNDILDFSKIEAGKMSLDPHPFHLGALIDDAVSLVELRAREKQLELMVNRAPDLPDWVYGDPLRLRQILVNLLSNAVKFTEHGYVSLDIVHQKDMVEIGVTDSGIGMNAEQVARLFAAFEQADNSTTRKFGGSGLGLAISRNLANLMGGDIVVRSSLGVGSKFTLSLPLPASEAGSEPGADEQPIGERLGGLRILAAEDVMLNRIVLEDLLVHEGAHVVFAENGQQALERFEEMGYSAFDAVLMDIQMPVMDGYQAARHILELVPELPVIGLTAHAMPEERQRCLEAGMRERITKPIAVDALVSAIRQHVPAKKTAEVSEYIESAGDSSLAPETHACESSGLIDWLALRERFEGREDFIGKLIENALDGTQQENLVTLRHAAQQADWAKVKFIAHNLKGFAGIFAAPELLQMAQQAEAAARDQRQDAGTKAEALADTLQCVLAELRERQAV